VSCQRIAGHGHEITEEIGVRLQAKMRHAVLQQLITKYTS
jgi:hypothetical protein